MSEDLSKVYQSSTCLHQLKKVIRSIYDENRTFVESKPSRVFSRGNFICTNHHCHVSTMTRDLISSELMGMKAITSFIEFPLAYFLG
jgi:hypothetical protein